jgi:hypothetical protein
MPPLPLYNAHLVARLSPAALVKADKRPQRLRRFSCFALHLALTTRSRFIAASLFTGLVRAGAGRKEQRGNEKLLHVSPTSETTERFRQIR